MIEAKVKEVHVSIKASGTGEELAEDVLRIIKALYEDLLEHDTIFKLGVKDFRGSILLNIEDVLDYNKLIERSKNK